MDKVLVYVLIAFFTAIISFMVANTATGIMIPIFDNMSASFSFMQGSGVDYNSTKALFVNAFFTALFIVVAIPIAYLFIRLLRKERQPQQEYQPVYFPGG